MNETRQVLHHHMTDLSAVRQAVGAVVDPELRRSLAELGMVGDITHSDIGVTVEVLLTIVGCPAANRIEREVQAAASAETSVPVTVRLSVMTAEQRDHMVSQLRGGKTARTSPFTPDSLTRVITVTSGKGGVGKSTVTANLAVALSGLGLRVGIIDADVHGFSIPGLLGLTSAKPTKVGDLIIPPEAFGVRVISIGMFVDDTSTAVAWRGPMLHRTISQFLTDVYFGDIDVLLLDLPPGTGDVAISIGQLLPHAEVLVVTTPQVAAAEVAERSGQVARQTGQRIRGVIETMSPMTLADGSSFELFGSGGGQTVADALSTGQDEPVALLGSVPLSVTLRAGGDSGIPVVIAHPEDPAAKAIRDIAHTLSLRPQSIAGKSLPLSPRSETGSATLST